MQPAALGWSCPATREALVGAAAVLWLSCPAKGPAGLSPSAAEGAGAMSESVQSALRGSRSLESLCKARLETCGGRGGDLAYSWMLLAHLHPRWCS